MVGALEVQVTTPDRAVHSEVIRAEEPIAADLPGDLAAAAGRLLHRLASDALACVTRSLANPQPGRSLAAKPITR